MAGDRDDAEKSEDPTQKKLDEALQRGDVAKSQEVSAWFVIAGATLILMSFSNGMGQGLAKTFTGFLSNLHRIPADGYAISRMMLKLGVEVIAVLAIPLLLLALAAIAGNMVQHRLVWSTEGLKPKLNKISPLGGVKRLFSKIALVNFVKGIFKIALVGAVMAMLLWPERERLEALVSTDVASVLPTTRTLSLQLLGAVVALLALIAGADFFFQYRQWYERQKMSLREMKEEFKQSEGDPHIKGKIRRLREQRAKKRMAAAVPNATVIITNPTHFAVALKYDKGDNAPVCVAKGVDAVALKIREIAGKHDVPIVENPPLARALHAGVDVDQEIPAEHYKAVAEIIGYVMRLRRAVAR
ncbi:MAG: flagellar biosynthesis protein FlhB [Pseudorhodoplanes sp.]